MGEENYITIGLALALVGGLLGLLRYINTELTQERLWREEADRELRDSVEETLSELRKNLEKISTDSSARYTLIYQEFIKSQREVAEKYATNEILDRSEGRILLAMDKQTARTEVLISRVETLSVDMARGKPRNS